MNITSLGKTHEINQLLINGSTSIPVPVIGGSRFMTEIESGRHRFKLFRHLGLKSFPAAVHKSCVQNLMEQAIIQEK